MTQEEIDAAAKADADKAAEEKGKTDFSELKTQVENLTKGIAGYRDATQAAERLAKEAVERAEKAEADFKKSQKSDVKLDPKEEEKFRAWAEKEGLATKADVSKERVQITVEQQKAAENQAVTEFLEKHPEYDSEDEWKKIAETFGLYKTPTSLTGFRQLLDRVYKEVSGSGDEKAKAEARAEITKKSRLSLGNGGSGKGGENDSEDIESLQKKYPSLSREVIENRLAEIKGLYKKK